MRFLAFSSFSYSHSAWSGKAKGSVESCFKEGAWIFYEKGVWTRQKHVSMDFTNTYVWKKDPSNLCIYLYHQHLGKEYRTSLVDFVYRSEKLVSKKAHQCGKDFYRASINLTIRGFDLNWLITGPRKNEKIQSYYFLSHDR